MHICHCRCMLLGELNADRRFGLGQEGNSCQRPCPSVRPSVLTLESARCRNDPATRPFVSWTVRDDSTDAHANLQLPRSFPGPYLFPRLGADRSGKGVLRKGLLVQDLKPSVCTVVCSKRCGRAGGSALMGGTSHLRVHSCSPRTPLPAERRERRAA